MVISVLKWQAFKVMTETVWPLKPEIFTIWPFIEKKFANSCSIRKRSFQWMFYMEMERLIWITTLNFLLSDSSISWQVNSKGTRMFIIDSIEILYLFTWLLSTTMWLSRFHKPIWQKRKLRLWKVKSFAQSHSVRKLKNWDSYLPSCSKFCLLSAKPHCFPRKRREKALAVREGLSRPCLSTEGLPKGGTWAAKSRETQNLEEKQGISLSLIHTSGGVEGGADPRVLNDVEKQQLFVRQQKKAKEKNTCMIKSLFHGLCCLCKASCQRESVIDMASLWGR